jgi:carbonic anhydrase
LSVTRRNVLRVVTQIRNQSQTLDNLVREERIAIVGAMYDVNTGDIEFLADDGTEQVCTKEPARLGR